MKKQIMTILLALPLLLLGCGEANQAANPPQVAVVQPVVATPAVVATTATMTALAAPLSATLAPGAALQLLAAANAAGTTAKVPYMSIDDLYAMVKVSFNPLTNNTAADAPYVTVDARTALDWNANHIASAMSIPQNDENTDIGASDLVSGLQHLPKGVLIVFYDDFLDVAPTLAQQFLFLNQNQNWGFDPSKVRIMLEGFSSWMDMKYPALSAHQ